MLTLEKQLTIPKDYCETQPDLWLYVYSQSPAQTTTSSWRN